MRSIRRVLVAVKDPGSRSLPAVAKAAWLARAFDAEIELFHAIDAPIYLDTFGLHGPSLKHIESDRRERHLGQLERIAGRMRRDGLRVRTAVEWDYPVHESVVRRATRIKADIIVAEVHRGRHVAPWLLHLTDWELLRLSPVPVLLVKNARPYRNPVVLAAVDPGHAFAKPARLDSEILRLASAVTAGLRGTLHAIHAYVPSLVGRPPQARTAATITAFINEEAAARAGTSFERVLRTVKIPPRRRHLVADHPINAISDVARQTRCDIAVMGAISRSGLKRVFIGNTAERVLDDLKCDLLVVKPQHVAPPVSRAARGPRLAVAPPLG